MLTEELSILIKKDIESFSNGLSEKTPTGLYKPISYVLEIGGKRLRPLLCLMAYSLYKDDVKTAMNAAVGIEVFHNFTLLHDDIMDNAEVRRGKPVVHKVWNANTAILSGDEMLIEAYKLVSQVPEKHLARVLQIFSETATGVCEGQQFDMDFEKMASVTKDEYINMIRLKTAVLLSGALCIGATLADAPQEDVKSLYDFGTNVGIAFQLRDDYLDAFGDEAVFGKKIGGDILCGKHTYLRISAFERAAAADRKELEMVFADKDMADEEKIAKILSLYQKAGADVDCLNAIDRYCAKALENVNNIRHNVSDKGFFADMVERLGKRNK